MADIKRCDLCGTPYEPYNYNMKFFTNHPNINENLEYANCMLLHIDMNYYQNLLNEELTYKFDMCPECKKALLEFIRTRRDMSCEKTEVYVDEE